MRPLPAAVARGQDPQGSRRARRTGRRSGLSAPPGRPGPAACPHAGAVRALREPAAACW
ncbi:hypothetical protein BLAT2472_140048 [Burkholderia latens]